jgi:hypothetical protein
MMSTRTFSIALAAFGALAALGATTGPAHANPRPLPFSYPYETLPAGALEVEQYVDTIPVRVAREEADGTTEGVVSLRSMLTTELEYGLTDRLEVALYFAFRQGGSADTPFLRFQGLKQRARYRFAEQGEWPINVGVYLEIAELHNEIELEEKILLSRRFGKLNVVANLWIEQEYYFQTEETKHIYNPTFGVSYEVSPKLSFGAEYWVRGRFDDTSTANNDADDIITKTVHYAGPTVLLQASKVWIAIGAYARLDNLGSGVNVGDPYGKIWVRTLLGIDL